jgi:hypothetical protein
VGLDDRETDRHDHDGEGEQPERHGERATGRRACTPVSAGNRDRQSDQHRTRSRCEQSGQVARGRPGRDDVHDVEQAIDEGQGTERERQPGAQAGPQQRKSGDARHTGAQRDRRGRGVLAHAHPRLAVCERVVERVHEDQHRGDDEDERLA